MASYATVLPGEPMEGRIRVLAPTPNTPHVVVLSPHAGIAGGLARLLSLDGRYDVRRVSSPDELDRLEMSWRADVILVDGAILRNADGMVTLHAPALLLAGEKEDAEQLLRRLPTARGWLRKDPTYTELERALASAGVAAPASTRRLSPVAMAGFAFAACGAAAACAWLLLN